MSPSKTVVAIVARRLGIDTDAVRTDADLYGQGVAIDGLVPIEITFDIEDAFDVELGDEDVEHAKTIADLIALVGAVALEGAR